MNVDANLARKLDSSIQSIVKAVVIGDDPPAQMSNAPGDATQTAVDSSGGIEPPYDPQALCMLAEHSNSLRQNVDAYATNIDGFGHRFEPAIDFDADDVNEQIADCIYLERLAREEEEGDLPEPTEEEISTKTKALKRLARVEKARLDSFFESCCFDYSFVELRRRTRQDLEVTGNAFWEVLRDRRENIVKLIHVPSSTVRLLPLDVTPVSVTSRVRISPVSHDVVTTRKRVRRYVQLNGIDCTYFKELGDPRVVSKKTGELFPDSKKLLKADPSDAPATEMIHFAIHSPRSPYGIPRWVGTLLSVLGSREMEEVNYMYFDNKSIPPLAVFVSGGKLSEASIPRLKSFVEEELKGKNNFHKMLLLEAEGPGGVGDGSRAKIEMVPLTQAQQQDALFSEYDQRNIDKVGASFRVPRLLRGESHNYNRSVAEAQLRFAEDQVFQPERDEFDYFMNKRLLADMGIRFWRFRSQTPITRDPERTTNMLEKLVRVGVLTPAEGRVLAADVFNREFKKIKQDWVSRPITLTLATLQNAQNLEDQNSVSSLEKEANHLIKLRAQLLKEEDRLSDERFSELRKTVDIENTNEIRVPHDEFASWFGAEEKKDAM